MKKQFLFFIVFFLPIVVHADDSGTCGDNLTWIFEESTNKLIISGSGAMYDYGEDNGSSGFGADITPWANYINAIQTIEIEQGVTSIGIAAFYYHYNLTSVTIPSSVINIGVGAFASCDGLTSVTITNGVENIEHDAFSFCTSLTSVTIPNSVKNIGNDAFGGCDNLSSVYITDIESWCNINFGVFALSSSHKLYFNDTEITDVIIPNSISSIGDWTFHYSI